DIELAGTVLVDRMEIQNVLGADLGPGYAVVKMKATPKAAKPIHISPDDFTLLSRKDGERSPALAPGQIAGGGGVVVKEGAKLTVGTETNHLSYGGIGVARPRKAPSGGDSAAPGKDTPEKPNQEADNPLLAALKSKALADAETAKPA